MRRLARAGLVTLLLASLTFGGCKNNKIVVSHSAAAPFSPVRVKDGEVSKLEITGTTRTDRSLYEIPDSCVVISSDIRRSEIDLSEKLYMDIYARHPTKKTVQEAIQMVKKLDIEHGGGFLRYVLYVEDPSRPRTLYEQTSESLSTILKCLEASLSIK